MRLIVENSLEPKVKPRKNRGHAAGKWRIDMSLVLEHLLDEEKYMLSGLAYFHLPPDVMKRDFRALPLSLEDYVEMLPRCRRSYIIRKDSPEKTIAFTRQRQQYYRAILKRSNNLAGVRLMGYENDNYGAFGSTSQRVKTSLVALAFEDADSNLIVVFSGCEGRGLSAVLIDWTDCSLAGVGFTTRQQKRALRFYEGQLHQGTRQVGIIGHSKGGNLATHIYLNRLSHPPRVYCINAQPYCWLWLNDSQKAALKDERYEFIAHTGDVVVHAGYQSCVSRIVPVNPYLSKTRVVDFHCYDSQRFDEYGNLTGERILRKTASDMRRRIFADHIFEKAPAPEETLRRFESLLMQIPSLERLVGIALEEICLASNISTVILSLFAHGNSRRHLYPYIAKGRGAWRMRGVALLPDPGRMADAISAGLPVLYPTIREESAHLTQLGNILQMNIRSAGLFPIPNGDDACDGMLEVLCDDSASLSQEDLSLAFDMAFLLAQRISALEANQYPRPAPAPLLELSLKGFEPLLIDMYQYREFTCDSPSQKAALLAAFQRGAFSDNDQLTFDNWRFQPDDRSMLRNWRKQGVTVLKRAQGKSSARAFLTKACRRPLYSPEEASRLACFPLSLMDTPVSSLGEQDAITLSLAAALTKGIPLLVFDTQGFTKKDGLLFGASLRLLCEDKLATVLALN